MRVWAWEERRMSGVVEICVQGISSALAAQAGGADRIELCEDLAVGGVTPSCGQIAVACRRLTIPVHVLVRPRGGDFVYSEADFEVMQRDVEVVKSLAAAGIVLGVLHADGRVDRERCARLIGLARPLSVTFHKAIDEVTDPLGSLDDLIGLGVDRVLTSGGAPRAVEGLRRLAQWNGIAKGRIVIMAGGRITADDIRALAAAGLREFHFGSAACAMGRTDAQQVRRIVDAAQAVTM
jgi:copper homeostasis protein